MMTSVVQFKEQPSPQISKQIPPSVLLIGKKFAVDYIAPALFRLNTTGELVIKATGSLSIVTAVNVAEMVKRNIQGLFTKSITVGTDELVIATGERKRMSCIEIHLTKTNPQPPVMPQVMESAAAIDAIVPVEAKKKTRKKATTAKKKTTTRKKKATPAA